MVPPGNWWEIFKVFCCAKLPRGSMRTAGAAMPARTRARREMLMGVFLHFTGPDSQPLFSRGGSIAIRAHPVHIDRPGSCTAERLVHPLAVRGRFGKFRVAGLVVIGPR